MRRRISLLIASALVALSFLPAGTASADGGSLNDNPTLRCLVNLQLGADHSDPISTESAASITELSDGQLSCGSLHSFDGVEQLSSLRILRIDEADHASLTDLSPLAELLLLEDLHIASAPRITDLTPLGSLPNLERISLTATGASDVSVLAEMPRLRSLTFNDAPNLDITTLAALRQVRSLTFRYMSSTTAAGATIDLTGVGDMAGLTELDVHYSFLSDLAPLATAAQLETLTLSRNTISDLAPLRSLTSLTSLKLNENRIVDISPLQPLTRLTTLNLSHNDVTDLSALAGMDGLTALDLSMNKITEVTSLRGLPHVEQLDLSHNTIKDVRSLAGMTGVRTANLAYNQIDDVSGIATWKRAEDIHIANNAITDLRPLKDLRADVRAYSQIARVPDGTTVDKIGPIHDKRSRLCPVKMNASGNAAWSCWDGKFYGLVRTISGDVPGPAPTPSPAPSTPVPPTPTPSKQPTQGPPPFPTLPFSVYNTPGQHTVNGRLWRTACEPYSQTWRCRTEIWGTTVSVQNGRFTARNGWSFNNLTYLPSPHAMWAGNPLAHRKSWVAADGRTWRTECDTALTGRNGCRTWVTSRVIRNLAQPGSPARYGWDSVEVFNNMVQFR